MTQQLNSQIFAYAKQLTESAFKAQSLAFKSFEQITALQLSSLEKQAHVVAEFVANASEVRDADALRGLWEKGANLSRQQAENAVSVSQEIIALTQKTAESLSSIAQEQQKAANDAVAAPVDAVKKAAIK